MGLILYFKNIIEKCYKLADKAALFMIKNNSTILLFE